MNSTVITHRPIVGDIVSRYTPGKRTKIGVILGLQKKEIDYTTCRVAEEGCLVSYDNKPPIWEPIYSLVKIHA